jgi:carbonic anhydrase/acetyltransferase-like protein (isoleucine patch superfamily)
VEGDLAYRETLSRHRRVMALGENVPSVNANCFVAPNASVIGGVSIGKDSSVWYGSVVRGDDKHITIGDKTSIGDRAVIRSASSIGDSVIIGNGAIVDGARIDSESRVGAGSVIAAGAVIEKQAAVAAGSVVTGASHIKQGELWSGSPAKLERKLTAAEVELIRKEVDAMHACIGDHRAATSKTFKEIEQERHDLELVPHGVEPEYIEKA